MKLNFAVGFSGRWRVWGVFSAFWIAFEKDFAWGYIQMALSQAPNKEYYNTTTE